MFAAGVGHGGLVLNVVVVKKTMSPATAGKAVTRSSVESVFDFVSSLSNDFVPVAAPVSRTASRWYVVFLSVAGRRSLPVPMNTYWFVPPTFTVAIDWKIG